MMLLATVFVACSDDDDDDEKDKPAGKEKLISKITEISDEYPDEPAIYSYEYDEKGRITKRYDEDNTHVFTYKYNQNSILVTDQYGAIESEYTLNDKGFIISCIEIQNSEATTTNYTYDNNDQLIKIDVDPTGRFHSIYYYTWIDGNIQTIKKESYYGSELEHTSVTTFTYTEHEYDKFLISSLWGEDFLPSDGEDVLMDQGYTGKRCKNLIATVGDSSNKYIFDKEGYITKIEQTGYTYTITYKE